MPRHDDGPRAFALPMSKLQQLMEQAEQPPAPQPELAQVCDLEAAFARFADVHTFSAGDLVAERQGMGFIRIRPPVLIILRFLDLADECERNMVAAFTCHLTLARPDCVVAFKDEDGDLRITLHETWRLEPYKGAKL